MELQIFTKMRLLVILLCCGSYLSQAQQPSGGAKVITFSKSFLPATTEPPTTTLSTTTYITSTNKAPVTESMVRPVRPGVGGPDGGNDGRKPEISGTRPVIQPNGKEPGTDLHGMSTTTQSTTTTIPTTTTTEIPKMNKTEAQLKEEFPWIENPETTLNASTVPNDGKSRLTDINSIRKLVNLNESFYEFVPQLGAKAPNEDKKYRIRINQKFKGIPVYGGRLAAEQENTGLIIQDSLDGSVVSSIEDDVKDITPTIRETKALRIAKEEHGDLRRRIVDPYIELNIRMVNGKATLSYKIEYFVPEDYVRRWFFFRRRNCPNARDGEFPVSDDATESDVTTSKGFLRRFIYCPPRRPVTIIDAHTGQVYSAWDGLASLYKRIDMLVGNPTSGYSSQKVIVTNLGNGMCEYTSFPLPNKKIVRLFDFGKPSVVQFPCDEANSLNYDFQNGGASPRNAAFFWTTEAIKYLKIVSNLDLKTDVNILVNVGGNQPHWTGKSASQLFFPNGDYLFHTMTTPDIVAHEVGHIFTDDNSNLEMRGQSGAISEAFSDMTAVAFMHSKFETEDFRIGHLASKAGVALRDICDPTTNQVLSWNPLKPNRDNAIFSAPSDNIHQGAGVFNKAFCMLSKSPGWNIKDAYKVFLDANTFYWSPETTFTTGACGVRKAAADLKGAGSITLIDNIFKQVGIVCSA